MKGRSPDRGGAFTFRGTEAVLNNPWEQELEVVAVGNLVDDVRPGDRLIIENYQGDLLLLGLDFDDRAVIVERSKVTARIHREGEDERVTCDARGSW